MAGQGGAEVEMQVLQRVEMQGRKARHLDQLRVADAGEGGVGLVGVVGVRCKTGKAKDRRPVGGMADPGEGEEPCSEARSPWKWKGEARRVSRNRAAATIGPMVWDDEGPIPTLNMSKTERNIRPSGW
jgi:hypothetical protein